MDKVDYSILREGDYILTASGSVLASLIRIKEAGLKHLFDLTIANHAGQLILDESGKLVMAEMLKTLTLTPLETYLNNGLFGDRVVMVKRNPIYDSAVNRYSLRTRVMADVKKVTEYDYTGDIEFLLPFIHQDPNKFYCSEYVRRNTFLDGGELNVNEKNRDLISPYDIQLSNSAYCVTNNICTA